MIINLSTEKFDNRGGLDRYVESSLLTVPASEIHIEGTKEELSKLSLSETVNVYGVKVVLLLDPELVKKPKKGK